MPYASEAQRGLFHSPNSPVGKAEVKKWDKESKGQTGLPYHVKKAEGGEVAPPEGLAHGGSAHCPSCGHHFALGGEVSHWPEDYAWDQKMKAMYEHTDEGTGWGPLDDGPRHFAMGGTPLSFASKLAQDQHFKSRMAPFKKR